MKENLQIAGIVDLELVSKDGLVKYKNTINNLTTIAGKNLAVRRLLGDQETISSIGIGSGTTAAADTDTSLESSLANEDIRFQFIDSINNNILVNSTTFAENVGTGTINEVGLFSNSSPQKLLCRAIVNTPFEKAATDYLNVSWKIKIG
jgi:hypothetical protein